MPVRVGHTKGDTNGTGFLLGLITSVARRCQNAVVIYPIVAWDRQPPKIVDMEFREFTTQYIFHRPCTAKETLDCIISLSAFRDSQGTIDIDASVQTATAAFDKERKQHKEDMTKLKNDIEAGIVDREKSEGKLVKALNDVKTMKGERDDFREKLKKATKKCEDCKAKDKACNVKDVENRRLAAEIKDLETKISSIESTVPIIMKEPVKPPLVPGPLQDTHGSIASQSSALTSMIQMPLMNNPSNLMLCYMQQQQQAQQAQQQQAQQQQFMMAMMMNSNNK